MRVLVVAPHPDDETLGCGGALFRHADEGDELFWLIVTGIEIDSGWSSDAVRRREGEIQAVAESYGFSSVFQLGFSTTLLDTVPMAELVGKISEVYKAIDPQVIYMPFVNDVHTDHQVIAKALQSTFKWFRYPSVRKVLVYETLSETEFAFVDARAFSPNVFLDIASYLDKKIECMRIYKSELGEYPFPRSEKTLRALATIRGSQSGFEAAEAFELIYEKR